MTNGIRKWTEFGVWVEGERGSQNKVSIEHSRRTSVRLGKPVTPTRGLTSLVPSFPLLSSLQFTRSYFLDMSPQPDPPAKPTDGSPEDTAPDKTGSDQLSKGTGEVKVKVSV